MLEIRRPEFSCVLSAPGRGWYYFIKYVLATIYFSNCIKLCLQYVLKFKTTSNFFTEILKLQRNVEHYNILLTKDNQPTQTEDEDKNLFLYTRTAFEVLGFCDEDIVDVFKIIAFILKLGNLQFVPSNNIDGTEGCTIKNDYGTKTVTAVVTDYWSLVFRIVWSIWTFSCGIQFATSIVNVSPTRRRNYSRFKCRRCNKKKKYSVQNVVQ